jgi:bifunctional non-homologous end joining protein LigD
MAPAQTVTIGGQRLRITNLDKVLYPVTGTTKADVLRYYAEIAPYLIPYARNRPVTRKRWVHGVGTADHPGEVFFQKQIEDSAPEWVPRGRIKHSDRTVEYPLVNDVATLTWLAQSAALELHVPQWQFSRLGDPRNPDRMVIDLDPGEGVGLQECAEVADLARQILHGMGLDPYPVTSGSKGIHLYSALDGKLTSDQVSAVAHELARALEADHPDLIVSDMKKAIRGGKVLVDWSQNNAAKTTIAPYSLRGRPHPTVAAPRTWEELDSGSLEQLQFEDVLARLRENGDPLRGLVASSTLEPTPEHMATFESTAEARDRLAKYRSMRDSSKTPEPVPLEPAAPSTGTSFVIQEHHARRLHYDFRLEHDGVLVSWAIPKGPPTSSAENHLAVQTEDHPVEYGTFEGTIPAGEYGAGLVKIWDAGTYDVEKWRDKEVIVTLSGRPDGGLGGVPRKYALIKTGGADAKANWLIHLMEGKGRSAAARHSPAGGRRTIVGKTSPDRLVSPMLATAGTPGDIDTGDDWAYEVKWDGYRAIIAVDGDQVTVTSRNGLDFTATFPELLDPLRGAVIPSRAILDGEIVALNSQGVPDFGLLQTRAGLTRPTDTERAAKKAPATIVLFDILDLDGSPLVDETYDERRSALTRVIKPSTVVHVPPAMDGELEAVLSGVTEIGLEGVVAKRRSSTYTIGRRSREWIKLKTLRTQEVIVIGWQEGGGELRASVGSLLLGIPIDGELRYSGKVGTGFSDADRRAMLREFRDLEQGFCSAVGVPSAQAARSHWIRPEFVAEVAYSDRTGAGSLRHPTWRGWRPDKDPTDVRLEIAAPIPRR